MTRPTRGRWPRRSATGGPSAEELVDRGAATGSQPRDGEVNAFTVVLADEALARAREIDGGDPRREDRSLLGVPVSVKDHIWLAGAAGHERLARACATSCRTSTPSRRAAAGGRRDRRRQDQQPGVLLPRLHRQRPVRPDPQPLVTRPDTGRLQSVAPVPRSRTARRRSRWAPTAAARSGSRPRSAGWSGTSRRSAWCRRCPASAAGRRSRSTARSPAPSATPRSRCR